MQEEGASWRVDAAGDTRRYVLHPLPNVRVMFDVLQTLSNSCATDRIVPCLTLSLLWIVLVAGTVQVLCAIFNRTITVEEAKEEKK